MHTISSRQLLGSATTSLGVQRELKKDLRLDASCNAAHSSVPVLQRMDALPQQYWSTGNTRNNDVVTFDNFNSNFDTLSPDSQFEVG